MSNQQRSNEINVRRHQLHQEYDGEGSVELAGPFDDRRLRDVAVKVGKVAEALDIRDGAGVIPGTTLANLRAGRTGADADAYIEVAEWVEAAVCRWPTLSATQLLTRFRGEGGHCAAKRFRTLVTVAQSDRALLRIELVKAAAVLVGWIAALDGEALVVAQAATA